MKKLNLLILAALFAFTGCGKKADDVNVELVTVENEVKTVGSTQAYFECEFEYLNEITKALLVYCVRGSTVMMVSGSLVQLVARETLLLEKEEVSALKIVLSEGSAVIAAAISSL